MKGRLDRWGRLLIPKQLWDELGLAPGAALELEVIDGRLEVTPTSSVSLEDGPHGLRFTGGEPGSLDTAAVRRLLERGRRSSGRSGGEAREARS